MLIFPIMAPAAFSDGVEIIAASPGDTITYNGHASPNSDVRIEISASISIGASKSGSNYTYNLKLNGIKTPSGMSIGITVHPVDTLNVKVSLAGIVVTSQSYPVNNKAGSASNNNFASGKYNVELYGIANGSGPVKLDVSASQTKSVAGDGAYTYSLSTSGLPASVYSIRQNGVQIAQVYLGVTAPATPTPEPTPTPVPTATPTPTPAPNSTSLPSGNPSIQAIANVPSPSMEWQDTSSNILPANESIIAPAATIGTATPLHADASTMPALSAPIQISAQFDSTRVAIIIILSLTALLEIYYVFFVAKKK